MRASDRHFKSIKRTVRGTGRRAKVLEPFRLDEQTWFYADGTNFAFVREVAGQPTNTQQFKVPTRLLREALALLDEVR